MAARLTRVQKFVVEKLRDGFTLTMPKERWEVGSYVALSRLTEGADGRPVWDWYRVNWRTYDALDRKGLLKQLPPPDDDGDYVWRFGLKLVEQFAAEERAGLNEAMASLAEKLHDAPQSSKRAYEVYREGLLRGRTAAQAE
jgi:hypothetical protein